MWFHTRVFSAVQNLGRPYWLTLSPMYLWMLIFFTRPHKEERFLFPIYPLICLSGAVALSSLQVCFAFLHLFLTFKLKQQFELVGLIRVVNFFSCRNATTSFSSGTVSSTTQSPPTGWLSVQSWSSQCCHCLALSPSSEVCVHTGTVLLSTIVRLYNTCDNSRLTNFFFSFYRLPCPSGLVPRVSPHCQGSNSALSPWRQAC